ncbi:9625_t:CDS:2, partial [Funneliformis caledonium]
DRTKGTRASFDIRPQSTGRESRQPREPQHEQPPYILGNNPKFDDTEYDISYTDNITVFGLSFSFEFHDLEYLEIAIFVIAIYNVIDRLHSSLI